ncbi:MAG: hypothetical protein ACRDB2_08260 [Fusobacteriaceae bacterium]
MKRQKEKMVVNYMNYSITFDDVGSDDCLIELSNNDTGKVQQMMMSSAVSLEQLLFAVKMFSSKKII